MLRQNLGSQHSGKWCLNLWDSEWGTKFLILFLSQTKQSCLPSSEAHSRHPWSACERPLCEAALKINVFTFLLSTRLFLSSCLHPSDCLPLWGTGFILKTLIFLISFLLPSFIYFSVLSIPNIWHFCISSFLFIPLCLHSLAECRKLTCNSSFLEVVNS